jgi:large subunit ribosomal protein L10
MPRPEKVQAVAEIKERIEGSQAVFLAEYAGLSVKDQQILRRELRANGAEFKVVKMTLARLAAAELKIDSLDELLLGPTGLAFADGDPVNAAKALKDFAKTHDVLVIKGGLLGTDFLSPESISKLAEIEPREVLLAKLAGAMQAPMANLAGLMAALPRNTANAILQLLEKKQEAAPVAEPEEAPVEEAAAEEVPAEDAPVAETDESVEADSSDDAPEASEDGAAETSEDGDEPQEEANDEDAEETEDDSEAKVEASDDDSDETEDQADEASEDDAEEE